MITLKGLHGDVQSTGQTCGLHLQTNEAVDPKYIGENIFS